VRPFYFMVTFWGERYREYFVRYLLPSLMAPKNLPLLNAKDGHRFLLATTLSDWNAISELPIMHAVRRHITPTLVEIRHEETAAGSVGALLHCHSAMSMMLKPALDARAYGSFFSPDTIVSDGMVLSLIDHVAKGHQLLLCPVLRQSEEPCISELQSRGYIGGNGSAIIVPQRVLADLIVRHLHPDMHRYEQGHWAQPDVPPFRYWKIGAGMILHTFCSVPVLLDYAAVRPADVKKATTFVEEAYAPVVFGHCDMHVVNDSDEFCILSLTPASVSRMPQELASKQISDIRPDIASSRYLYTQGMQKRTELFRHSIRWHADDIEADFSATDRCIQAIVNEALDQPYPIWARLRLTIARVFRRMNLIFRAAVGNREARAHVVEAFNRRFLYPRSVSSDD
jgi:hypothetical protein